MAGVVGKFCSKSNFHCKNFFRTSKASFTSFKNYPKRRTMMLVGGGVVAVGTATFCYSLQQSVNAHEFATHHPEYPWSHHGLFNTFDHASLRRGYEVYKQVCAACHGLEKVAYRMLVGVSHTENEAKAEAEEAMIMDGPDDEGKMFQRPGKLPDYFPDPYPNENAARFANNGALPPDLGFIVMAREGQEDYIFSILTGYFDPPEKVEIPEGQHFNAYFSGGSIGMAKALYNETIEYSDGTPATASQLAKDVTTFLRWAAEPHYEDRAKLKLKTAIVLVPFIILGWYFNRRLWLSLKSRKIMYKPK